jgi:hypothetical protein
MEYTYPKSKVMFHLKSKSGTYTLVKYNKDRIVYTTKLLSHENKTLVADKEDYKCISSLGMKNIKTGIKKKIPMSIDEELFDITMKETASLSHKIDRSYRNKLFDYLNSLSKTQQWDYFVGCKKHNARPKK